MYTKDSINTRVISDYFGVGTITDYANNTGYPVIVYFDKEPDRIRSFTQYGVHSHNDNKEPENIRPYKEPATTENNETLQSELIILLEGYIRTTDKTEKEVLTAAIVYKKQQMAEAKRNMHFIKGSLFDVYNITKETIALRDSLKFDTQDKEHEFIYSLAELLQTAIIHSKQR